MSPSAILAFAAVSFTIIAVPGPSVLFAVSRAIAAGRRNALLTVLGNAFGLFAQVGLVAVGLGAVLAGSDLARDLLRLVGASYLAWLGIVAIRHRHDAADAAEAAEAAEAVSLPTSVRPCREGFVVGLTNPKSLVFLAVFLPGFVDPDAGPVAVQVIALGALFCLIALVSDGAWALLAVRARLWFASDPRRLSRTSVAGGLVMISLSLLLLLG